MNSLTFISISKHWAIDDSQTLCNHSNIKLKGRFPKSLVLNINRINRIYLIYLSHIGYHLRGTPGAILLSLIGVPTLHGSYGGVRKP